MGWGGGGSEGNERGEGFKLKLEGEGRWEVRESAE
jgi:hypothetical protein